MPIATVLCAVEPGDLASRVIRHAAGLAGAAGAQLTLLTVFNGRASLDDETRLQQLFNDAVPYGATYLGDVLFRAESGDVVDVMLSVSDGYDLLVTGTHGRAGLARLLLGSTSTPILERATRPVMLVPPTDIDIVTLDFNSIGLHASCILAAVDLADINTAQLALSAELSVMARRPWQCLTVTSDGVDHHHATAALRQATRGCDPHPSAFIVRRGDVPEEIARGAMQEKAGIVVMGLHAGPRHPGRVATAVARTGRSLVLAVPE